MNRPGDDGSALRLEQRTELNQAYEDYCESSPYETQETLTRTVTVRSYEDGSFELGYSSVQYSRKGGESSTERERTTKLSDDEKLARRAANIARSIRRSKAQVRRKCMAGGLDHLLTLTYRRNLTESKIAFADFKRFVRLVRAKYPSWKYLAVLEYQKRGACHLHVAVQGFQDVRFLRSCWLAVVGSGNIDVRGPAKRGPARWSLPRLAGYLSKYITKNSAFQNARQRYRVSEGIEIKKLTFVHSFPKFHDFVAEVFETLGTKVAFHWKGEGGQHGWACNWSN